MLASMPHISCAAVLFGDSGDRVMTFQPSKDQSYFITRTVSGARSRPAFEFGQTPVNFARLLNSGWQIRRWEFENTKFEIAQGTVLRFRRIDTPAQGVFNEQSIRVLEVFPIKQNGKIVDRLYVLVDDWGRWRSRGKPPERKWHIYSERANAVLLHSILYVKGSNSRQWDRTNFKLIVYMKGTNWDLLIDSDQLAPLRDYMANLDIWNIR